MIFKLKMDLNLDAGELPELLANGTEEALYQFVSSINIACGGHAGDKKSMARCVSLAQKYRLRIGAHPSFPDQENFGRRILKMSHDNLFNSLFQQIESLRIICEDLGAELCHIKPHGALYNLAAFDFEYAQTLIMTVKKLKTTLPIVGLSGSSLIAWLQAAGLNSLQEAFCDRTYESTGQLVRREIPGAVIVDPKLAANQALMILQKKQVVARTGEVLMVNAETLCIHGDHPNALAVVKAVNQALRQ